MNQLTRELLEILTCQVCWQTLTGRIFRCGSEHLVCEECLQKLEICPTCREPLKRKSRSLSMEQVAELLRVPCDYCEVGCPELVPLKTQRQHEATCPFGPNAKSAQCPLLYSCCWQGSRASVEQHVRLDHKEALVVSLDGTFTAATSPATLLEFDSAVFVVRAESVPESDFTSHYVHVGHVAQGLRAAHTRYRFKVRRDLDDGFFKGLVTDYRQPLQDLAVANDCLFFVTQEADKVTYSGSIKKFPLK